MTGLQGKHAVVTGAGGGIGAAVVAELARLGASLTLVGRTAASLKGSVAILCGKSRGRG